MKCPRCTQALIDVRGVGVCKSCGGAFLPSTLAERVERALDPDMQDIGTDAASLGSRRVNVAVAATCPSCAATMRRYKVGAVEIDSCADHGSWYDRGELALVKAAIHRGARTVEMAPVAAVGAVVGAALVDPALQAKLDAFAREEQRNAQSEIIPYVEAAGGVVDAVEIVAVIVDFFGSVIGAASDL
jgi:hypothetical protein